MTAAHCLVDIESKGIPITVIVYDPNTSGERRIDLATGDFRIQVSTIYKMYQGVLSEGIPAAEEFVSDVAMIEIANSSGILDNEHFINIHTPGQIVDAVWDLNDYMFNPKTQLYALGWGGGIGSLVLRQNLPKQIPALIHWVLV